MLAWRNIDFSSNCYVEAFLEKTAIAYHQNVVLFLKFGWYAIAVGVFKVKNGWGKKRVDTGTCISLQKVMVQ